MAKNTSNTPHVFVAIDVAKRWNEVLIEIPEGRQVDGVFRGDSSLLSL